MVAQGQNVATTSKLAIVRLFWRHTTPSLSDQAQLGMEMSLQPQAYMYFLYELYLIQKE
jgi:hypothetical protein